MLVNPCVLTNVYFIRHGIAADRSLYSQDANRPLTEKGQFRTRQVAQRLRQLGCQSDLLLSSPYLRAWQTAEIFVSEQLAPEVQSLSPLAPGGDLSEWLQWLAQWQAQTPQSRLMLVGHEPDLSQWAQRLVHGTPCDRWILKKAGVIGITLPAAVEAIAHSQLFWLTPPRLLLMPSGRVR